MTGVGAPRRVAAFAAASGYSVVADASFPDHARVGPERLRAAMLHASRRGAEVILITEKDEHRWALPSDPPLPVRVLRTGLTPLDPTGA
jgi:tetraacyldisaccharide-1-P 4'-kinase